MTDKELRELDAWIAEHVMGYRRRKTERRDEIELPTIDGKKWCGLSLISGYTTDPAAAMVVLEKCCEETIHEDCIYVGKADSEEWIVGHTRNIEGVGDTLPLAICLFAKQLFHAQEKETKVH